MIVVFCMSILTMAPLVKATSTTALVNIGIAYYSGDAIYMDGNLTINKQVQYDAIASEEYDYIINLFSGTSTGNATYDNVWSYITWACEEYDSVDVVYYGMCYEDEIGYGSATVDHYICEDGYVGSGVFNGSRFLNSTSFIDNEYDYTALRGWFSFTNDGLKGWTLALTGYFEADLPAGSSTSTTWSNYTPLGGEYCFIIGTQADWGICVDTPPVYMYDVKPLDTANDKKIAIEAFKLWSISGYASASTLSSNQYSDDWDFVLDSDIHDLWDADNRDIPSGCHLEERGTWGVDYQAQLWDDYGHLIWCQAVGNSLDPFYNYQNAWVHPNTGQLYSQFFELDCQGYQSAHVWY